MGQLHASIGKGKGSPYNRPWGPKMGSRGVTRSWAWARGGDGVGSHTPRPLYPRGKRPGTYCTGCWVGPRAGLDSCGKSRLYQDSIPDRPARSESRYRLSYRGSPMAALNKLNIQCRGSVGSHKWLQSTHSWTLIHFILVLLSFTCMKRIKLIYY
jgi:hypothetical protein